MIVRDANDNPTHIRIDTLDIDGRTLTAEPPLVLDVAENSDPEDDPWWVVDDMDWGVWEADEAIDVVQSNVQDSLRHSWREYAEAADDELSPAGLELKRRLREWFRMIETASPDGGGVVGEEG